MNIPNDYKTAFEAGATATILIVLMLIVAVEVSAQSNPIPSRLEPLMRSELPDGAACLLDIIEGTIIASWGEAIWLGEGRPAGSVLKLFTSYALIAAGESATTVFYCPPSSVDVPATDSCWYKPGHGNMTLKTALAFSCNAYFRQWVAAADDAPAEKFFRKLRLLESKLPDSAVERAKWLTGLSHQIRPKPVMLISALAALFNGGVIYSIESLEEGSRCAPVTSLLIDAHALGVISAGLRECAASGTAAAAQAAVGIEPLMAKTGTSVHIDGGEADSLRTDGFCFLLYPAERPRYLLAVFSPDGRGGGRAAEAAGVIMARLIEELAR